MLRILVAPTAFKGSFLPKAVAEAIADGVRGAASDPDSVELTLLPLADGGDGTIEAVALGAGGVIKEEQVLGPLSVPVVAPWLKLHGEALVELASTSGLALLQPEELNPLNAHTYGLGQIMCRCQEAAVPVINVALGGSASSDGGMGALRALGATFFDKEGHELSKLGGAALKLITDCDLTALRLFERDLKVRILTDVDSPLLGDNGAAKVFARQKGADQEGIRLLEEALASFADVLERHTGKSVRDEPGAGAAGGTAFGLKACLNAEIISGFAWVAQSVMLDAKLQSCDLVISGEGCFDLQSLAGKVAGQLLASCRRSGKPLWVVAGSVDAIAKHEMSAAPDKIILAADNSAVQASLRDISAAVKRAITASGLLAGK